MMTGKMMSDYVPTVLAERVLRAVRQGYDTAESLAELLTCMYMGGYCNAMQQYEQDSGETFTPEERTGMVNVETIMQGRLWRVVVDNLNEFELETVRERAAEVVAAYSAVVELPPDFPTPPDYDERIRVTLNRIYSVVGNLLNAVVERLGGKLGTTRYDPDAYKVIVDRECEAMRPPVGVGARDSK